MRLTIVSTMAGFALAQLAYGAGWTHALHRHSRQLARAALIGYARGYMAAVEDLGSGGASVRRSDLPEEGPSSACVEPFCDGAAGEETGGAA